jgi:hypothetical protein
VYKHEGFWVFDDDRVGLIKEGLVSGADLMIDELVKTVPHPNTGFNLTFSSVPFPQFDIKLQWSHIEETDIGGNWYFCSDLNQCGWLCTSLYLYYTDAPDELYIKVSECC